jgi:DNA repair protein RecO (recombination protein O)
VGTPLAARLYRDEAVVLRKLDYADADRIYTLLTREHGKVGAIAKGVRKSTSKLAGSLELFARIDVQLAGGRSLDVITQVVRLPGPRMIADLEWTACAGLVVELADRVTEDRHPMDGIYELTVAALEDMARAAEPRRAAAWYLWGALRLLGFEPQLFGCASCGLPLPAAPAAFTPVAGGFLCPDCALPGMRLSPLTVLKVLRVMAAEDIDLFRRLRLDGALLDELERILDAQIEHHLDRRLRSLRFLRQMTTPPALA